MKRSALLFLFPLFVLLLASCSEVPCNKAEMSLRLIGFSDTEAGTFVIKRFTKNTTTLVDSFVFDPSNPVQFARFTDTLIMTAAPSTTLLQSQYDYIFNFPEASRSIPITEIEENQSHLSRGLFDTKKLACVNDLKSCKVDGQLVTAFQFPNTVYIRK